MKWSELVVTVEIMFIDKSGGCCHRCRAVASDLRVVVSRTFNYCLTLMNSPRSQQTVTDGSTTLRLALRCAQWTLSGVNPFSIRVMAV